MKRYVSKQKGIWKRVIFAFIQFGEPKYFLVMFSLHKQESFYFYSKFLTSLTEQTSTHTHTHGWCLTATKPCLLSSVMEIIKNVVRVLLFITLGWPLLSTRTKINDMRFKRQKSFHSFVLRVYIHLWVLYFLNLLSYCMLC